jgi:hypothetical protein
MVTVPEFFIFDAHGVTDIPVIVAPFGTLLRDTAYESFAPTAVVDT